MRPGFVVSGPSQPPGQAGFSGSPQVTPGMRSVPDSDGVGNAGVGTGVLLVVQGSGVRDVLRHHTGAPGRDRTCDQVLRRHLLYPLSYGRSTHDHRIRAGVQAVRPRLADR